MRLSLVILLVIVTACSFVWAADWNAEWIGVKGESVPNSWYCFRKEFNLGDEPGEAIARIACDSKYWLWINGDLVVFEGQLKRGPTPEDSYCDELDIVSWLQQGENTVAALLWYWGKDGFSHNDSGKAGFIFEADIDGNEIASGSDWLATMNPAYGSTAAPHPNYRLSEPHILYDARKALNGWQKPDYDDSSWSNADAFGQPPAAPWNELETRPIPQWKDSGLIDYDSVKVVENEDGSKTVIGKLPCNCQITPYMRLRASAGDRIDIRTDNYRGGGIPNVRSLYCARDGVQEYESLGWMNGHDLRYTMPAEVEVLAVKYRETGYNADFAGSFRCDDEALNLLWKKAKRTLYVTMRDNYMDCPDRERAQWWGDAVNELGEAFYVFDAERGPLLARKAIRELARWQRGDDVLFSPVPAGVPDERGSRVRNGRWDRELPRQILASVGWYGFWTYYWYTGDKQTIADVYPHVRDYLALWKLGEDGLVIHRKGDWDWTDWGRHKDVPVIENAWVYLAMKAAVEMAALSGHDDDIPAYRAKMESIAENFNKTFWRGDKYRSPAYERKTDDRAQAMAVVAGLAKPEYYPAIKDVLKTQYHASPYMEKYVLEALCMMDAPGQSIQRIKKRWQSQLESELTTLWEHWDLSGTYNHAWSGGPLTILSQYIAGVYPLAPAFRRFAVEPQMGPLERIDAVVPSKFGDIELHLRRGDRLTMDLMVPEQTTAELRLPVAEIGKTLLVNGESVDVNDISNLDGVISVAEMDDRLALELESGHWKLGI